MSAIHVLDSSITNLIAAGEVVERPSSVVKELVENSIDAGSTKITVEITGGGIKRIKVSDNGIGMSPEDAVTAFLKHATSKIATKDDLYSINTLGFRGEALCAISAVSEVTLITKRRDDVFATEVRLEAGKVVSNEETSYEDGTSISVSNLFYNTPARYKFLRAEPAEAGAVTSLMECLALSHPNIAFRYLINGAEKFYTTGSGDLAETIYLVCGREYSNSMLEVNCSVPYKSGDISVKGYCSKPFFSKANRNKQYFFINGRYIRSRVLQNALENAYKSYIMVGRFPVCFLFITLDPRDIDINVHPGKLEVKFSDDKAVYGLISEGVAEAVNGDRVSEQLGFTEKKIPESKPQPTIIHSQTPTPVTAPVPERKQAIEKIIGENLTKKTEPIVYEDWVMTPPPSQAPVLRDSAPEGKVSFGKYEIETPEPVILPAVEEKPVVTAANINVSAEDFDTEVHEEKTIQKPEQTVLSEEVSDFRIIGECFKSFIIIERGDCVVFIDKHALHERMNFEKLKENKNISSQKLLTPIVFSTSAENCAYICENSERLAEYGFETEDFGNNTILIRAVPDMLNPNDAEGLLENFANVRTDSKKLADAELFDVFLYDVACKMSIKAGKSLTDVEMEALISEYFKHKDTLKCCPHGRPIEFSVSKREMEKQFKRIV